VANAEPAVANAELVVANAEPVVANAEPPMAPVDSAVNSVEPLPPPRGESDIIAANKDAPAVPPAPAAVKAPSVDAEIEEKRRRDQQHFMLARRRHRMR
jgi:hypothetical protein